MSTGLETLRQMVANYLNRKGVPAVTAWADTPRLELERPFVVVSLRKCKVESSGFQNYLGERYDSQDGRWVERYGKKAQLTLGLDIYASDRSGGDGIQSAFDTLADALLLDGPDGLDLQELSCGQTTWDRSNRRLKRPAEAVFSTYLCAVTSGDGAFTDFILRGVVKQ